MIWEEQNGILRGGLEAEAHDGAMAAVSYMTRQTPLHDETKALLYREDMFFLQ